jgi:hypothetical protein
LNILLTKEGAKGQGLLKFPSEVDKYIKTKVVGDAINLMRKKKHKADRSAIERFGCWKRILPSDDDEEYLTFTKAKYLFDRLMNKKGASAMTLVCFGKIAKISCLKNLINRVQIDLLYKRVTQMNKTSQMDLNTFFDAMEELAN